MEIITAPSLFDKVKPVLTSLDNVSARKNMETIAIRVQGAAYFVFGVCSLSALSHTAGFLLGSPSCILSLAVDLVVGLISNEFFQIAKNYATLSEPHPSDKKIIEKSNTPEKLAAHLTEKLFFRTWITKSLEKALKEPIPELTLTSITSSLTHTFT